MRITAVIYVAAARFRLSIPRSPFFVLVAFQINEIKVQVFTKNVQSTSSKKKTKQNKTKQVRKFSRSKEHNLGILGLTDRMKIENSKLFLL